MDTERISSFDRDDMSLSARRSREVGETRTSRGSVAPRRRVMDIEDAVQWAVRDELPKREYGAGAVGGIGYPSCSPMFRMVDLGVPIDECNFSREPGFPMAAGAPHPDALKIEAAINALERFKTVPIEGDLDLGPDFAADPKEEAAAMRRAFGSIDGLVFRMSKLRTRPYWQSRPTQSKVTQPNGKPVIMRWETHTVKLFGDRTMVDEQLVAVSPIRADVYPEGAYCALQYDQDPRTILEERAEYLAWWAGLNALAEDLFESLETIAVLQPSAAQKPWLGEKEAGKPPRIFKDLTARIYQKESRETAAAHRALGQRRVHPARRGMPATPIARRTSAQPAALMA